MPEYRHFSKRETRKQATFLRISIHRLIMFPFFFLRFCQLPFAEKKKATEKSTNSFSEVHWQIVSISSSQLIAFSNWSLRAKLCLWSLDEFKRNFRSAAHRWGIPGWIISDYDGYMLCFDSRCRARQAEEFRQWDAKYSLIAILFEYLLSKEMNAWFILFIAW